ncbi:regulator [Streptomyces hirsutus]|uniref:regulator n=1 Tax=Streptomyces hirsutus TaxID=35620 RepID=UPI0033BF4103
MIPALSHQQLHDTCTALSSASLIRLVSEIDDHGAIPVCGLARTLADLSTRRIRQAIEQADALGLLTRTPGSVGLSAAGRDLADVYDATARWARRHNYPAPLCDFAGRIQHTFALLGTSAAGEHVGELGRIHRLMAEWVHTHQRNRSTYGVAA